MKKNKFVIFFIFIIVFFIVLNGYVKAQSTKEQQLTKEQLEAFRSAKKVRIVVEQSYGAAKDVNLPFEDLTKRLVKYAGLTVVESEIRASDLRLVIKAKGMAKLGHYLPNNYYYTGASLMGSVEFDCPEVPIYKREFEAVVKPPLMFTTTDKKHETAAGAPFSTAYKQNGSFIPLIVDMMGKVYGTDLLNDLIKDRSHRVRISAISALANFNDSRTVSLLITLLKDRDQEARFAAEAALGKIKNPPAQPLVAALKDGNKLVRFKAAEGLWNLEDPRAFNPLIEALEDLSREYSGQASKLLCRTKDPRLVELLIVAGGVPIQTINRILLKIRSYAIGPLMKLMNSSEAKNRKNATWFLENMSASLIEELKDNRTSTDADELLVSIGGPAVKPLVELLSHKSYLIRTGASNILVEMDSIAVDSLLAILKDESSPHRSDAGIILGKIGDPRAVEPVLEALKDKNFPHRDYVIVGIGKSGNKWVFKLLLDVLEDESSRFRGEAAYVLGWSRDPRAVEPLIAALKGRDWSFISSERNSIINALGSLKDPRAIAPLIDSMSSNRFPYPVVCSMLTKITGIDFGQSPKKWRKWWKKNKKKYLKKK